MQSTMTQGRADSEEKTNVGRGGNAPSVPADTETFNRFHLTSIVQSKMTKYRVDNDEKITQDGRGNAPNVPADTETFKISGPEDLRDELLPGIPTDIAFQAITPKLSGVDINVLSLVSPSWQEAIHRRWVYDARVRSLSTEPFVIALSDQFEPDSKVPYRTIELRLYSLKDNSVYDLPPIPSPEGIRYGSKCIAFDGKIYILGGGGLRWSHDHVLGSACSHENWRGRRKVFMLDLAGHKQWKLCASMQEGRRQFSAGVLDGKIYVFGGMNGQKPVYKSEVYDPMADAWSSIEDMVPGRIGHQVAALGGELVVYGGIVSMGPSGNFANRVPATTAVAYNPVKNDWRELEHSGTGNRANPWLDASCHVFVAQGKFHELTPHGVDVYDIDTNSWSVLHSFPGFPGRISDFFNRIALGYFWALCIWDLGEEILVLHLLRDRGVYRLSQTRGFGNNRENALEEIRNCHLGSELWHDLNSRGYLLYFDMCLIQL